MGGNKDWITTGVAEFDKFQDKYCNDIDDNLVVWDIDSDKNDILQELKVIYDDFYAVSKNKRKASPSDYLSTNKARKNFKKYIRTFTKEEIKFNTSMTNTNRFRIGVPNEIKAAKKSEVSLKSPTVKYVRMSRLIGKYTFTPKRKPKGQRSYQIKTGFYLKGETPPTERKCTQVDITSQSSDPIIYDAENYGMLFVSYIRYRNSSNKLGNVATIFYGVVG